MPSTNVRDDEPTAADISESATVHGPVVAHPLPAEGPLPTEIAGFRVVGKLGQGGMGIVYEAEQANPRRRVALKVMRAGHAGDGVRARLFRREVEALARLHHPGIAAIHEAGQTDEGLDYFAMELVPGVPLDAWMKGRGAEDGREPPPLAERLRVFARICEAVAYAHACGVVHRDLKPSNICVDDTGGTPPHVKVLDFGLARVTTEGVPAGESEAGIIRGTLSYMSPEQVRAEPDRIDARSDVYSLGVILYELVTGWLPYAVHWNRLAEAARVICEEAPAIPRLEAGSSRQRVDRDIQTIILKALAKEPSRRYASAFALAGDITAYLDGQPISARAPSAAYQLRKLVQRHRAASALAAAFLVVLVAFALAMAVQSARVARERDRAERESARAQQVSGFLARLFEGADPGESRGGSVTVREMLDRGAERIAHELSDQPEVRAELLNTMAWSYQGLGQYDRAVALAEEALRARRDAHDAADPGVTHALVMLGALLREKGDFAAAEARLREAEAQPGPMEPATTANLLTNLALVSWETGRAAGAEPLLRRSIEIRRGLLGAEHQDVANGLNNLALVLHDLGRFAEAETTFREALTIRRRVLGAHHPRTLNTLHLLGRTLREQGRLDEGEALVREAMAARERVLGSAHPDLVHSLTTLAGFSQRRGDVETALVQLHGALARAEALPGGAPLRVARVRVMLAAILDAEGRKAEAAQQYRAAISLFERSGPGSDAERGRAEAALAQVLLDGPALP